MSVVYFGERWDAPVFDGVLCRQAPTPVGEKCRGCDEPVISGDQGFIHPLLSNHGHGVVPIHRECQLRSFLGGLEHLEGRCEYTGHCHVLRRAAGRSIRDDALAVWDWVQRHGVGEVT